MRFENCHRDAVGDQCPLPVVKATRALRELTEPAVLEVRVDNEIAVQNLTRMAAGNRLPVRSEKKGERLFVVTMEAAQPVGDAPVEEPELTCIPDSRGDLVVAVDAEAMGRGSDEQGKLLMKSFLFAVGQLPRLPRTMLFYNGGAKLTVEDSASLEDLKGLEAQGVEILTCGTCLNFYGLRTSWLWGASPTCTPSWRPWRAPGRSSSHDLLGQRRHYPGQAAGRGGGGHRRHGGARQQRPGRP